MPGVLWFGGRLVLDKELTPGNLTSFMIYKVTVGFAFGALTSLYGDFMKAVGAGDRIFQLLDRQPEIRFSGGDVLPYVEGNLKFENVSFSYPSREGVVVLKDINLSLQPGMTVALVGHSGGGKTTIASLIELFYLPSSGTIKLDGRDIKELDPLFVRKKIGLVSQEPCLFAKTILDNIAYGMDPEEFSSEEEKMERVQEVALIANAQEFINQFPEKYQTIVGERGIKLSGGQKQRIAIARALLKRPKILILDEATSSLDSESEYLVKEAIDQLISQKEGRAVLVIAHRLSTVKNADIVCVIESGKIVEQGTHKELIEKKRRII